MWFVVCAADEKDCQLFWSSAVVSCFRWLIVSDSSVWLILCCSFEWQDMTSLCYWLVCYSIIISADPRLLGALRKTGGGGGGMKMKEWMKRNCPCFTQWFHSVSNRAHGKRSRNSISSVALHAFNSFFFSKSKRLYDIHVTWFGWFFRREHDSASH